MLQNFKKSPLSWVPSVYFAMGLPFIAINTVSTIIFSDLGVSDTDITYWTSLLLLPWSLKWLISPLMEAFGTKRMYLIITEIISAIFFGAIIFCLPFSNFFLISIGLFAVIAVSGSIHDIAGDGVYMEQLDNETQSLYSGWQGAFYNIAKVLANGGLVFLAGWLVSEYNFSHLHAWQYVLGIFGILMCAIGIYHLKMLPKDKKEEKSTSFNEKIELIVRSFIDFLGKKYIFLYLIFIFLYRFAEGLAVKVAPLFLKKEVALGGIGLDNLQYGLIYGTYGTIAFILGSILGGYYISRFGLKKVLFSLVCIFNIPFVVYLLLAIYQPTQILLITIGIVLEYFSYGFGFVGIILFMMQQIAPGKYQMAHYAFANSLVNLGVMIPGMISGYLSNPDNQSKLLLSIGGEQLLHTFEPYLGYILFFSFVMIMTLPSIVMSWFIPFTHPDK